MNRQREGAKIGSCRREWDWINISVFGEKRDEMVSKLKQAAQKVIVEWG